MKDYNLRLHLIIGTNKMMSEVDKLLASKQLIPEVKEAIQKQREEREKAEAFEKLNDEEKKQFLIEKEKLKKEKLKEEKKESIPHYTNKKSISNYIKSNHSITSISKDALTAIESRFLKLLDEACKRAILNHRKTLLPTDI